ncbi:MAG: hypothetical protein RJA71_527 [Actinomycetota bacterium]
MRNQEKFLYAMYLQLNRDNQTSIKKVWCGRRDLNPHAEAQVPKTCVSAISPLPRRGQD